MLAVRIVAPRVLRLAGERRVVERVARAVQADDEPVADELVLANAFHGGEILDAAHGPGRIGVDRPREDSEDDKH
jgi:hypothetical protein